MSKFSLGIGAKLLGKTVFTSMESTAMQPKSLKQPRVSRVSLDVVKTVRPRLKYRLAISFGENVFLDLCLPKKSHVDNMTQVVFFKPLAARSLRA